MVEQRPIKVFRRIQLPFMGGVRTPPLLLKAQQLSIGHKIYWGYGIALGIAVAGVVVGLIVGNRVQTNAQQKLSTATQQMELMSRLLFVSSQFQPQREFVPVRRNQSRLLKAKDRFENRVETVEWLLIKIARSTTPNTADSTQVFLDAYKLIFDDYVTEQKRILDIAKLEASTEQTLTASEVADQLESELNDFVVRPEAVRFFRYTNEIASLLEVVNQDSIAAQAAFFRANGLRTQIIVVSMLLSAVLATVLAIITGQAIIQPIRQVTSVAQTVTETGNFEQRAPEIMGRGEIAVLSTALNQLIAWVDEYMEELKQAQAQLIQSEKMSSLGQMTAGIAHEINNPVNFISGNLPHVNSYVENLLKLIQLYEACIDHPSPQIKKLSDEIDFDFLREDLPNALASINIGVDRIQKLVLSLRSFSRVDESTSKEVDIHEGIDNTLILLSSQLKQGIKVIKDYGEIPPIECYPAQLNQVFMNLLANSIDALLEDCEKPDKQIKIRTRSHFNMVSIEIQDNGVGILDDLRKKLFDPFFTTKAVGKGTGLGLAISYQIIKKHSGSIDLDSHLGIGTSFVVKIPHRISAGSDD